MPLKFCDGKCFTNRFITVNYNTGDSNLGFLFINAFNKSISSSLSFLFSIELIHQVLNSSVKIGIIAYGDYNNDSNKLGCVPL